VTCSGRDAYASLKVYRLRGSHELLSSDILGHRRSRRREPLLWIFWKCCYIINDNDNQEKTYAAYASLISSSSQAFQARGGSSPIFSSPSWTRAFKVEPEL